MLIDSIDDRVYELATDRQKEIIDTVREVGGQLAAGRVLGINESTVRKLLKAAIARAAKKGYSPAQGLNSVYPEGYVMQKVTVQRGSSGDVERTWERMCADSDKHLELLKDAIIAICDEASSLPPVPVPPVKHLKEDLMVNIPIGDAHIGMLAWGEESGEDYDLRIAEEVHKAAIDMLIEATPDAKYCTIIDLGDFMHSDNIMGVTTRSGHSLDMDGRYHKVVRVAIRISNYYIQRALQKFEHVTYRPEVGNHNDVGSIWMQELLHILYADEPRVTIGNCAGNMFFWQHGLCYFGSHHGHEIKFDKLPAIMSAHIMDQHVRTKFRKVYCGHVHHKSIRGADFNTCEVQTYRTLAPKDAYSASHGYHAPRGICAETWHKSHGHVSTVNVNIPMLGDRSA